MDSKLAIGIVAALVIASGAWYWYASSAVQSPASAEEPGAQQDAGGADAPLSATVTYTATAGFEPQTVTIKEGGTVTFVNQSGRDMWIGGGPHPDHDSYDGTTRSEHCAPGYAGPAPFDECGTGDSYSFTFTKAGSFHYHNHRLDEDYGTITVVE
jgi:plastocyanin